MTIQTKAGQTPSVTVVIPAFNEERYIIPCLESLKNQSLPPAEIITVVQGSDHTSDICRAYGCRVIKQPNPGVSLARANGFSAATSPVIATTDADTVVPPDWVENISKFFSIHPEFVCLYGPYSYSEKFKGSGSLALCNLLYSQLSSYLRRPIVSGCNLAIRKSAYDKSPGFDTSLTVSEDNDLVRKVSRFGRVGFSSKIRVSTSSRRLQKVGLWKYSGFYIKNYIFARYNRNRSSEFLPVD